MCTSCKARYFLAPASSLQPFLPFLVQETGFQDQPAFAQIVRFLGSPQSPLPPLHIGLPLKNQLICCVLPQTLPASCSLFRQ